MKNTALVLAAYGIFLILIGLLGYLSNPEKAKTALLSGGTFGFLNLALASLAHRGWRRAVPVALGLALFLGLVFAWRSAVSWAAFAGGQPGKLTAAVLISAMLLATAGLIGWLIQSLRSRRKS